MPKILIVAPGESVGREMEISDEEALVRGFYSPHPLPVLPTQVTMAQARTALRRAGMLVAVGEAVLASGDEDAQIAWEYSTVVSRDSNLVRTLSAGLGLTDEQLDALFLAASQIEF